MISWRPENVIRHLPWRLDRQSAIGILLILTIFSLVGWLYLTQASAVTTTTYRIDELRLELDQIKNQNAALSLEIAQFESLARIETRSLELGLRPTASVRYLPVTNYPDTPSVERVDYYHLGQGHDIVGSNSADFDFAAWWIATLDDITAWLAK